MTMTGRNRRVRRLVACALTATLAVTAQAATSTDAIETAAVGSLEAGGALARAVRLNPPEVVRSVFVLGDSLMVGVVDGRYVTGPSLLEVLADSGVEASADVRVARTIPQATAGLVASRDAISRADVVVVGLGTNDIFNSGQISLDTWRSSIGSLVDAIGAINPTARIVWIDVSFPRVGNRAVAFNALLGTFADAGSLEVCPWRSYILAHPEWVGGDGLHLRADGYAARRNLILSCIGPR